MNYRFIVPLMLTAFLELAVISMTRITTSYRAIELGLSPIWLGLLTAVYAILPILLAVKVGRFIDRGNDAVTAWIGGGLLVIACTGFAFSQSLLTLMISTAILGIAHLLMAITLQVLCTRQSGPGNIDRMLGNYMIATSLGQGCGAYLVGLVGGDGQIPPTHLVFLIALATSITLLISSLTLPPSPELKKKAHDSKPIPVREIIRYPGFKVTLFASVMGVVAQDLIVVYLPLLGAERGMTVDSVGTLLAVRSAASMLSRFFFARLNKFFGSSRLMAISTLAGAAAYAALALPLPFAGMLAVIAMTGSSLGISVTVGMASLLTVASAEARGTANSLRVVGNRLGQVAIPFLAGLLAASAGAASIFVIIGASLATAGSIVHFNRGKP